MSSSRGQDNFRGHEASEEAKAKDLIFEAKAKVFKMCPRGQGRPRGLHLCLLHYLLLDGRKIYATVYGCWLRELEMSACLRMKIVKL